MGGGDEVDDDTGALGFDRLGNLGDAFAFW